VRLVRVKEMVDPVQYLGQHSFEFRMVAEVCSSILSERKILDAGFVVDVGAQMK
jgi:hypothetical protein